MYIGEPQKHKHWYSQQSTTQRQYTTFANDILQHNTLQHATAQTGTQSQVNRWLICLRWAMAMGRE